MSKPTVKITVEITDVANASRNSEVILALTKRAELAEERLAKVAGILKGLSAAEHKVSPSDARQAEKLTQIRAHALNKLDCVVSYLNE